MLLELINGPASAHSNVIFDYPLACTLLIKRWCVLIWLSVSDFDVFAWQNNPPHNRFLPWRHYFHLGNCCIDLVDTCFDANLKNCVMAEVKENRKENGKKGQKSGKKRAVIIALMWLLNGFFCRISLGLFSFFLFLFDKTTLYKTDDAMFLMRGMKETRG